MNPNPGIWTLRALSIVPAVIGLLVLGLAAIFALLIREPLWLVFLLGSALSVPAIILFRCSYRAWRQPTPEVVRDICNWIGSTGIIIALLAFEPLRSAGYLWIAIAVAVGVILSMSFFETWLARRLVRKIFGPDRFRA